MRISELRAYPATPSIKFFKDAVDYIVSGQKTLEPCPRTMAWIDRLKKATTANFACGPRFQPPHIFATVRIIDVTIRPFDSVTMEDLQHIGYGWESRTCAEFIDEYQQWYAKELAKNYPVAWISFEVIN